MSLSGTCGGALSSAMFGVPSVAFSARNSTHRPYTSLTNSPYDPATLSGGLVADLVSSLAGGWDKASGEPLLPKGTGLNVNFPYLNESCSAPPFVLSSESDRLNSIRLCEAHTRTHSQTWLAERTLMALS